METVIIENVDKKKASLIKALCKQLGLKVTSKGKKKIPSKDSGIVTNPEIIRSIKEYEAGKSKLISFNSMAELKKALKKTKKPV